MFVLEKNFIVASEAAIPECAIEPSVWDWGKWNTQWIMNKAGIGLRATLAAVSVHTNCCKISLLMKSLVSLLIFNGLVTHMFQYQQKPVSPWYQSGSWWIYPWKQKRCLCEKLAAHKKDEIEMKTQTCFLWHLKAEKTPLWPRHLQSERSCHSSRSWHCQRPPAGGWHWWFDLPVSPAKASAVLTSEAPHFLSAPTVLILTVVLDSPSFCQK